MLLSLVIVDVEITSFTVACFSLVALLCFFSSIKKKSQQKKIKKLWTKKGTKSVCAPPPLLIIPGAVLPSPLPFSTISHQTQKWGSRSVCRFVKRRNQVFAQFVRPLSSGTAASKIRKVLFLEIVLVEKVITLFCVLSTTFFLPLSSPLSPSFSPVLCSHLYLTRLPQTPQVLLESALKHWSRVKRYVAQDGSG